MMTKGTDMDQATLAAALNEWMRRYTEEPEKFEREWQTVGRFLAEQASGREPTYGEECAAYLAHIAEELATGRRKRVRRTAATST